MQTLYALAGSSIAASQLHRQAAERDLTEKMANEFCVQAAAAAVMSLFVHNSPADAAAEKEEGSRPLLQGPLIKWRTSLTYLLTVGRAGGDTLNSFLLYALQPLL